MTVASVKRRKRRILAARDTTELNVLSVSSDDYAASSADISSSSSSNEDNSDAVCRQHIIRKEMPSDQGSDADFCIPTPMSDSSVTTKDSENVSTKVQPASFDTQNPHLRCCNVDLWNNVNDVADASQQSDDAGQPLDANSPTVAVSEQNHSAVNIQSPGKLVQSQTLVVDTPESSQNWISVSTTGMSHPRDVLLMTEQESGCTVLSISSSEDRYVPCSEHAEFDVDAAAHFRTELLSSSSIATDMSSDTCSLCHERKTGALVSDMNARIYSLCKNLAVHEPALSHNDRLCHEVQQGKDSSNDDRDLVQVFQFDGTHSYSSVYRSVFCEPALLLQDCCSSQDDTDLSVGADARVEDGTSRKQNLDVHLGRQVTSSSDIESSGNMQEQYVHSVGSSALSLSDRFDEVVDGCIECESNEAGSSSAKNSEQPGTEGLLGVSVESDSFDEVVGAANQAAVREDLMPVNDRKLREYEPSSESVFCYGNCQTADGIGVVSHPRSHSINHYQTGLAERPENTEDWFNGVEANSVVKETNSDAELTVSVERQPLDADDSTHLPVKCAGVYVTESENDTLVYSGPQTLCLANVVQCEPEMIVEVARDSCSDSLYVIAPEEDRLTAYSNSWNAPKNASTSLADMGQDTQLSGGVTAYFGEAAQQRTSGSVGDEVTSGVDVCAPEIDANDGQMSNEFGSVLGDESCDKHITDESGEENEMANSSGTGHNNQHLLPLETSDQCVSVTGAVVEMQSENSTDSTNGEYDANSDLESSLNAKLREHGADRNMKIAGSYPEKFSMLCASAKTDSCEKGEPLEETGPRGTLDDKQKVFPADSLPASVIHKPGQSSVASDSLHGVPSVSVGYNAKEPLIDSRLMSPALEPAASRFESEMMTDSSECGELYNKIRNISSVDCVNADLGSAVASGNVDSGKETMESEQNSATDLAGYDSDVAVSTVLSSITAILDSPAVSQFGTFGHELHQDIIDTGRDGSSSGGHSVSGPSTAEVVGDNSAPDEAVKQAFHCCTSSGLNLNNHDQHKAVDEKLEESRKEAVPEMSMKAVSDCLIADTESAFHSPVTSAVSMSESCKAEAEKLVDNELNIGAHSLLDVNTAVVAGSQTVAEPPTISADSALKTVCTDKNSEHIDFAGKQEFAISPSATKDDAEKEMNIVFTETSGDINKQINDDDGGQNEIAQHPQFSVGNLDVFHSSDDKQKSCGQLELYAVESKEVISAELVLTDAVGNKPEYGVSLDVADKFANSSCVEDICDFSIRLDQQLKVTEGNVMIITTESLLESGTTVSEEHDDPLDQLLPHDVATDLLLVQTEWDSADIGVDDEAGGKPCECVLTNAADEQAHSCGKYINTWQNNTAQESSPEGAVADHQEELVKPDMTNQPERPAAKFQAAGLSNDGTTDELLIFPESDGTACGGDGTTMLFFPMAVEWINSSAVTENLNADSFVIQNEDSSVIQHLKQPTSNMTESCQGQVGLAKVQQDYLTSAVSDSVFTTVDYAVMLPDSLSSDHIEEELDKTDVDMVVVADEGTVAFAGITGDIAMSAVADATVVPVSNSAHSGPKNHTLDAAVGFVNSSQGERASEWQSAKNNSDLALAKVQIGSSGGDDSAGCIVPSVINSGETDVAEIVSVREPQVMHVDTGIPTIAINMTQETTALLNDAAAVSFVHFAMLQDKINDTDSVVTVSANGTSDKIASTSVASGLTETVEYKSTNGQNAANFDFSLAKTAALLSLPNTDIIHGVDALSITDSSLADPGTGVSGLNMQNFEEHASVVSLSSQNSTVDSTDDSGDEQDEQLPAVIFGFTADAERNAIGYIQGVSTCENEATKTATLVNNVTSISAAESMPSTADDDINYDIWYSSGSQHQPANSNAVIAKQSEFTELPSILGSAEGQVVTVTRNACGYLSAETNACDKDADHTDTDSVTEKMTITDDNQICVTEKHKDLTVQVFSLLPLDFKCHDVAGGDQITTETCSAEFIEENSNIITENTAMVVDRTTEVSKSGQKPFHSDNAVSICVAAEVECTSEETSNVMNASNIVESVSGDSIVCNAFDGSKMSPVNSAVDMPVDRRSELQVLFSESVASSNESEEISSAIGLTDALYKKSDGDVFCDGHDSGSVDLNSVSDDQCIAALDTVVEVAAEDKPESWKRNAAADKTTLTKSFASPQATISYTDSHSLVAGAADKPVIQDLAKNICDVTTDARHCDKETDVAQQCLSLSDDGFGEVTPNMATAVAHAAYIGDGVCETALISVVDVSEKPHADEISQADELPADKCLDSRGSTEPHHDSTLGLRFPKDAVTNMLLFEGDTRQHQRSAQAVTGDLQPQQLNDVERAIIDTEMVTEHQQTSVKHVTSGPAVLHDASDKDSSAHEQQQPVSVMATAVLSTLEGIFSTVVAADDQQIIDGHVVSRHLVPTDDRDAVNRSQCNSPENTQCKTDCQLNRHKVPVMEGDDDDLLLTARNSHEHSLPASVGYCMIVLNAEKNGLPASTPSSDHLDTTMSPCYRNDDSNIPEARSISLVSPVNLDVVQTDAKSAAAKDNRDLQFSAVISDVSSFESSGLSGVLNGGSSGMVDNTGEMDRMADDLMIPTCLHSDVAVTREQNNSELLLIANQHSEGIEISTNQMEFYSGGSAVEKTGGREVSCFNGDNRENGEDADALSGDAEYPMMNDTATNMSNKWAEQLASADTYRSASHSTVNVDSSDEISESRGTAHSHIKSVASARLNVCEMQRTSVAVSDASMVPACVEGQAESLDQHATSGSSYVCAETSVNVVGPVPVVAGSEKVVESNQKIPILNVEFTPAGHDHSVTAVTAHKLDDSECSTEQTSIQIQPQLAVSHPSRTENVRTSSKQTSGDNTALRHPSSQVAQSAACIESLAVQVKSVDGRVQRPRSSKTKKTKLTDTEVLGIDLEPEKQRSIVESPLLQSPDVEIIMSGHSTIGLGRRTDFEYHSIGLQPVGTQQPKFSPGPEQVLRDEVAEQYPESFWHSALDIEIRPQSRANIQETRDDAQIAVHPHGGTYVTGAAAVRDQDGAGTCIASDETETDFRTEVKDSVIVTQRNRSDGPLRGMCVASDREPDGQQATVGGASSVFNDSLVDILQGLSNRKSEHCHVTVNGDAATSGISHQFPAYWRPSGRSQIYDVGIDLFRSKSAEHIDLDDVQPDCRLVRSQPDLSIMSARRSCRCHHRRRLAQPMLVNSSLSKSDQELLGSTSALFEDLLPHFKDLPFCSSLDGIDSETDEDKLIRGDSGRFENFLLPEYCNLPSVSGNDADSGRAVHPGCDPTVRIVCSDIAGDTLYDSDFQNNLFDMPFNRMTAETDLRQLYTTPADECGNHRDALKHTTCDDEVDRTQSMDSITYVFVGHGASSLEAVGDNHSSMVRFSSEPSSCLCENAIDTHRHVPIHSRSYGVLTESSSDSCLLSADTECPTPTQRSLSCTGLGDQNPDSSGFSDEFTSNIWTGHQEMPTTLCQSDFEHNETGAQTSDGVGPLKNDASLSTSIHGEIAVQTNKCLHESFAKQTTSSFSSIRRSRLEAETQTCENRQQYPHCSGDLDQLTYHTDGSVNTGKQFMHGNKSRTTMPLHSGHEVQSDTLDLASMAVACHVGNTHPVDEPFMSKEQSNIGTYGQVPQSSDDDSHQSMKKNDTIQNWPHGDISARTFSTQSLPCGTHDQDQLSARHILRSSSIGRTIETQTYPEMRVIETQTPIDRETCGTQTLHCNDVESGDQIPALVPVPLPVSSPASSPELLTSTVNRPRIELLSPLTGVVTSQLMMSAASGMPVITTSGAVDLESASRSVVGSVQSSFTADDPPVTAINHASTDQMSSVAVLTGSDTAERWCDPMCERSSSTTNVLPHYSLSQDAGSLHEPGTQRAEGGSIPSTHSLLSREGFPSCGSDLAGYHGQFQAVHGGPSINSGYLCNLTSDDVQSTQTTANDGRLLANTVDKNIQCSAALPGGLVDLGLSSCQDHTAHIPCGTCNGNRLLDSSTIQSLSSTLSPASNSDLEMIRTQDFLWRQTQEEEKQSKLMAEKILEKYRMKKTANDEHVVHIGNETNTSTPPYDNYARLSQSRSQASSSYSHADDSGIVDSRHNLSPLTRTLLGYSDVSCDKSTVTETSHQRTAGWYDELERLRRERQQIIDMLAREVIPSRIQVELTEAHLNYLIGQTDTLLQRVDETPVTRDVLEADFGAFCRTRLEASQRYTEAQIQQLERIGKEKETLVKAPRLVANLENYGQRDETADVRGNLTAERHYSTHSPVCNFCSHAWSPSWREQFLLGIRREIVSATTSQPVPPVHSSSSRLHTQSFQRSWPNRGHLTAHSSYLNLGPDDSMHEVEPEWRPSSSLTATPAASLQHLDRRRQSFLASSVDEEINSLLSECREARQRAHVEISRAMDTIQRTSSTWTSSPLSSHRYFLT